MNLIEVVRFYTFYDPFVNPFVSLCRRWYKDDLCALAFKVVHDKQRGPLVFLRIYSGTMKPQTAVHNINRNTVYVALSRQQQIISDGVAKHDDEHLEGF